MTSLLKVMLIGNVCKDPEMKHMQNGDAVTNITVACNENWKNKDGEKQERVEFVRITFYRKLAEIAGEYLKKGRQVYVEGRLETKKWTDKEGVERYTTGIVASEMKMLGPRPSAVEKESAPMVSSRDSGFGDMDDDIPFN